MSEKEDTPVLTFIKQAWEYAGGDPHSWERFNDEVRTVVLIAASSFPWKEGDIDRILEIGNWKSYVMRAVGEAGFESLYSAAVNNGNVSAWKEIERYLKREPIIADKVDNRKRSRICVGSTFPWKGEMVTCTSFNKDGHATCCSYKPRKYGTDGYQIGTEKILHRFTISGEIVKADRKAQKEWKRKQATNNNAQTSNIKTGV